MIGEGDNIEPVPLGFVEADGRPDLPIGKDCMFMEIAGEGDIALDLREVQDLLLRKCKQCKEDKKSCKDVSFHSRVLMVCQK